MGEKGRLMLIHLATACQRVVPYGIENGRAPAMNPLAHRPRGVGRSRNTGPARAGSSTISACTALLIAFGFAKPLWFAQAPWTRAELS